MKPEVPSYIHRSDQDYIARERRLVWLKASAVMGVTLLPYLYGAFLVGHQPLKEIVSWFTFNVADHCGYLSWMRQAADGHFFQQHLFTTAPQSGLQFNIFFLALGNIARFIQLPLIFVYHVARMVSGIVFLRVVWWILELLISELTRDREIDRAEENGKFIFIFAYIQGIENYLNLKGI